MILTATKGLIMHQSQQAILLAGINNGKSQISTNRTYYRIFFLFYPASHSLQLTKWKHLGHKILHCTERVNNAPILAGHTVSGRYHKNGKSREQHIHKQNLL